MTINRFHVGVFCKRNQAKRKNHPKFTQTTRLHQINFNEVKNAYFTKPYKDNSKEQYIKVEAHGRKVIKPSDC